MKTKQKIVCDTNYSNAYSKIGIRGVMEINTTVCFGKEFLCISVLLLLFRQLIMCKACSPRAILE